MPGLTTGPAPSQNELVPAILNMPAAAALKAAVVADPRFRKPRHSEHDFNLDALVTFLLTPLKPSWVIPFRLLLEAPQQPAKFTIVLALVQGRSYEEATAEPGEPAEVATVASNGASRKRS